MKRTVWVLALILFLIIFTKPSFAESTYVLPYPSFMPGNSMYYPRLFVSNLSRYIYFGDFGKFDYNLKESDHYLVEAKTLFEYKQYLLGFRALKKSDAYFKEIEPNLIRAKKNNKNIKERTSMLNNAAQKHIEVLEKLKNEVPSEFEWIPENSPATKLQMEKAINDSIKIRQQNL